MYLKLHPYKQTSLKRNGAENLNPRYYGPYKVIWEIGEVAYELELPEGSKIHNVFHVSCLKKSLGQQIVTLEIIPPLDDAKYSPLPMWHLHLVDPSIVLSIFLIVLLLNLLSLVFKIFSGTSVS